MKQKQPRDIKTKKYVHKLDVMCKCGHSLAMHTADSFEGLRPCIVGDFEDIDCSCEKFAKQKDKK